MKSKLVLAAFSVWTLASPFAQASSTEKLTISPGTSVWVGGQEVYCKNVAQTQQFCKCIFWQANSYYWSQVKLYDRTGGEPLVLWDQQYEYDRRIENGREAYRVCMAVLNSLEMCRI